MNGWMRYRSADGPRFGRIQDGVAYRVDAIGEIWDVLALPDLLSRVSDQALTIVADEVLPITDAPPSIRDFMSYEQHVSTLRTARGLEVPPVWYEQPVFYFTNPAAIHGPTDPVRVSPGSREFDYEIEVAVLLTGGGSDLEVEEAAALIGGFVLFCDWSARDLQLREYPASLGPAKGKDGATTLGPLLVEPSELDRWRGEHGDLRVSVRVNDETRTETTIGDPYWSFAQMVAYASRGTRLRAGDMIASGTVGAGCLWELRVSLGPEGYPWLRAGDRVEIDAGPLGLISTLIRPAPALKQIGSPNVEQP